MRYKQSKLKPSIKSLLDPQTIRAKTVYFAKNLSPPS